MAVQGRFDQPLAIANWLVLAADTKPTDATHGTKFGDTLCVTDTKALFVYGAAGWTQTSA